MDFAKNLLSKYGWKEGQGIGKNSDGIVQPVKVNLKFDSAGLGHDRGKEFTNHWWQNAFNNAANNINVNHNESDVSMSLKNGESIEITTKDYSLRDLKNNRKEKSSNGYGSFVKSNVALNSDKEAIATGQTEDEPKKEVFSSVLSDEALFKACGGRTAHKGARHGLSLGGKLNRIEEQERQLLEKYSKAFSSETANEVFKDWVQVDSKKKNKRRNAKQQNVETPPTPIIDINFDPLDVLKVSGLVSQDDYVVKYKSRKKKKQHRALDEELASTLSGLNTSSSKLNKEDSPEAVDDKLRGVQSTSTVIKKKKSKRNKNKKKKQKPVADTDLVDEDISVDELNQSKFKAENVQLAEYKPEKKTKKRKREVEVVPETSDDDDLELRHGQLSKQIQNELQKRPNKKFKVVIENMTKFQSKHLAKAGIPFVEKKNNDPAKLRKERREFDKIASKMRTSLSLDDDEGLEE